MNFNEYSKMLNKETKNSDVEKIAVAFSTAKILGYNKSLTDFSSDFIKYYDEAIHELEK